MKIECISHRDGGSKVDIDGIMYHFEPLADGAHVADVIEAKHQDRFLGISEGYKLYRGDLEPADTPTKINLPVVNDKADLRYQGETIARSLHGSDVHEATYNVDGTIIQLSEIVSKAFDASGLSAEDWNALEPEDRHARIDITLDEMADAIETQAPDQLPDDVTDERASLAEAYKAKFGKAPHYRASIDTIKAALAE